MAALSEQQINYTSNESEPNIVDITELCDYCVKLTEEILENDVGESKTTEQSLTFVPDVTPGMCQFCKILSTDPRIPYLSVMKHFISDYNLGLGWGGPRYSRICATGIGRHEFAVWANRGSPACASLNNRAPIVGPHMDQVCELTKHWLSMCSDHNDCILDKEVQMPTRVLAICEDGTRPSVRLVETRGRGGRYIALSHCWGSTGNRPLRTTARNLESHQDGISFENLPKTFQDCVEFSQCMGIKYVWIDSLCIIQDDHQDWLSEAAKMRDVYKNAALVVGASGAKDSTEGLFITNRPRARIFRLPYRVNGKIQGKFNMTQLYGQWDLFTGPLEKRAWTLQERYLAQRFLAFMPYGITWVCDGTAVDEVGRDIDTFADKRWYTLLQRYTMRSLTVSSDRPEAIKGIAEEFERSRRALDRYIPEYGVWEGKNVHQLLWFCDGEQFDDGELPHIPTWSWIATKDVKKWPDDVHCPEYEGIQKAEEMPRRLVISSTGYLHLAGHLSAKRRAESYVREASTLPDLNLQWLREFHDPYYRRRPKLSRTFHFITQNMHNASHQAVLGIVQFDHISKTAYTHVCFLAKQKRRSAKDWRSIQIAKAAEAEGLGEEWQEVPNEEGCEGGDVYEQKLYHWDSSLSEEEDDSTDDDSKIIWVYKRLKCAAVLDAPFVEEQTIGDVIYHIEQKPDFVYWVLLLEQVGESRFRRVGMGTLLPAAYEAFQVQVQEFSII